MKALSKPIREMPTRSFQANAHVLVRSHQGDELPHGLGSQERNARAEHAE
jgi:hypothetical protein